MASIPTGWGFPDAAAFDCHVIAMQLRDPDAAASRRQARWVSPERLQAYANMLSEPPELWQIMQHFHCCYASAIKHRRKLIDLIARRKSSERDLGDARDSEAEGGLE